LNPFQTPADLAQQALYLAGVAKGEGDTGAQNPLSQMPPLPKAMLAALTGTDTFSGQQLSGNPVERAFTGFVRSFPQAQIYERLWQKQNQPDRSFLFEPSPAMEAGKYLGLPARRVNRAYAQKLGGGSKVSGRVTLPNEVGDGRVTFIDGKAYYTSRYEPK
jgi:hypothetical protein